jgi:hydroxyacylglutathione hydrolase
MPEVIPIADEGLGNHSYLIELGDHRALLLDPSRDPRPYLAVAEKRRLTVAFSAETHLHADFISGSRELAAQGARVLAPATGRLEHPHRGLEDREEVDLGGLTLRALATPGHTPEHLSYLVLDAKRPLALFSGGALMPGSAARTDLISSTETDSLTRQLYRGVRERLFSLPDELPVYPTHGAGSFCSSASAGEPWTTIGREKAANPIFTVTDEDEFVRAFLGSLGSYPDYFLRLREINRRGPQVYGAGWPSLSPLSVEAVSASLPTNTIGLVSASQKVPGLVLDIRQRDEYATSRLPGALHIELGSLERTAGDLPAGPVMTYCGHGERAMMGASLLERTGRPDLAVLDGGIDAWERLHRPVEIGE